MKFISLVIAVASLAGFSACNPKTNHKDSNQRTTYFDVAGMDTAVKPGDDFFRYANGQWLKTSTIPDDQSGMGSFYAIYEDNLKKLNILLQDAQKANAAKGSIEQKLGDYYASGMDTTAIDKLGAQPLIPTLQKINALKDYTSVMNFIAAQNAISTTSLIGMYVASDEKNSKQNILNFHQSGLSLPEKGYYTRQDSTTTAARAALIEYAKQLFMLTGLDSVTAANNAKTILALETNVASAHLTPVDLRDTEKNYNKFSVADLEKRQPNVGWKNIIAKMNASADSINVSQPAYYDHINKLLASQSIEIWKTKLAFDFIASNASYLSKDFADANFKFSRTFSGQKKDSERWKKMVNRIDGGLGDLLGQLYVKKHFTEKAKKGMDELVNNLQKAFENRISNLDWMSDSTKDRAKIKLAAFLKKIGFPEKWKNYDDVTIDRNNYFANVQSVNTHNKKEETKKIGKPVDKTDWDMTAPTVNAYYNPTTNEIVFPAGILQFPFYDENADDAINYGGIGMVIGHEMTHGFDDQGSQYDEVGNMINWWTLVDSEKFKTKTKAVIQQYNAFTIFDSLHINGELTLGENIADIGGLAIAYDAFKLTKQGKDTVKIDGFTPDQRFFLGYAQVWRMKTRDEIARSRINNDTHSPSEFRVNGPVSNFDPFYQAFNVKEGDKLYIKPENRVRIW